MIELRHFYVYHQIAGTLLIQDLIYSSQYKSRLNTMKKQRRGLNRYNMLQDGKKRKKVFIHMHDALKTNCEENTQEKKTTKNGVNGIRTHIHENRWLLVYIYMYSKNEHSTYCAIESLENYM